MTVIELQRRYRELGRVRLGDKGPKGNPVKLATWRLTSPSQELLERAADIWGGKVKVWAEAPTQGEQYELLTTTDELNAYVPPQDLDRSQYLELWTAGGVKRRCDGVTELISGRECMCSPENRQCQITTHLLVILPQIPDLGVWRLTTHGWNAAGELPATVDLLRKVHQEGAIPAAVLAIEQRTKKAEGKTHHFAVPVLRLPYTMAEAERGGVHVLTQPRGRPALPGERPGLPDDPSFSGERAAEWGAPPALPDEAANGAATREQIVMLHTLAGKLGYGDTEKHELAGVESFNDLSRERAHELIEDWLGQVAQRAPEASAPDGEGGTDGEPQTAAAPTDGGEGQGERRVESPSAMVSSEREPSPSSDAPASEEAWARAAAAGLKAASALKIARKLGMQVRSASELTGDQLSKVLATHLDGEP